MATIGVTGHRVLCELDKIQESIAKALHKIQNHFQNRSLTLLTSLAEGSDRLVAIELLKIKDSRMVAVLPMDPQEYAKDFDSQESRIEFFDFLESSSDVVQMPAQGDRDAAYEAAGHYVEDHCDALICIWDGSNAQGRGGTGAIVERAREKGTPLAWIHAGNRKPGTMTPTSLGKDQGKITYMNF